MWITDNFWVIWIVLALVSLIVEMVFTQIYFLMISGGAVGGLLSGAFDPPILTQVIIFAVVSSALLLLVRPWIVGKLKQHSSERLTNIDALLGEKALALEAINESSGLVKIGGDTWTARTQGEEIPRGMTVTVQKIDGATAVVKLMGG